MPTGYSNIGAIYEEGRGIKQNYRQAYRWYYKSGKMGLASAQYKVGMMLIEGKGVKENYKKGLAWIQEAAKNNDPKAKITLKVLLSRVIQGMKETDNSSDKK